MCCWYVNFLCRLCLVLFYLFQTRFVLISKQARLGARRARQKGDKKRPGPSRQGINWCETLGHTCTRAHLRRRGCCIMCRWNPRRDALCFWLGLCNRITDLLRKKFANSWNFPSMKFRESRKRKHFIKCRNICCHWYCVRELILFADYSLVATGLFQKFIARARFSWANRFKISVFKPDA